MVLGVGAVIGGIVGGYARRGIGALVVRGGRAVDRGAEADQIAAREGLWQLQSVTLSP